MVTGSVLVLFQTEDDGGTGKENDEKMVMMILGHHRSWWRCCFLQPRAAVVPLDPQVNGGQYPYWSSALTPNTIRPDAGPWASWDVCAESLLQLGCENVPRCQYSRLDSAADSIYRILFSYMIWRQQSTNASTHIRWVEASFGRARRASLAPTIAEDLTLRGSLW